MIYMFSAVRAVRSEEFALWGRVSEFALSAGFQLSSSARAPARCVRMNMFVSVQLIGPSADGTLQSLQCSMLRVVNAAWSRHPYASSPARLQTASRQSSLRCQGREGVLTVVFATNVSKHSVTCSWQHVMTRSSCNAMRSKHCLVVVGSTLQDGTTANPCVSRCSSPTPVRPGRHGLRCCAARAPAALRSLTRPRRQARPCPGP